ncbi:helix-turn-helix transcriptional regulator [Sporosarcina sp. FSL W7-1349]|uniref:helix-turn-helix domain-containing protein n=1 Tax=Sporosarcina sp. FSL W7-1349 TaxID=2921561 RepID=UPI0030FC3DC8
MERFHIRLKECREKKKDVNSLWTQEYVAKKIGVARSTYTAYENGTKQPPLDTINNIADVLEVTTDYLLGRSDNPRMTEDEEFEAFANDPELERWYRELPGSDEEDVRKLREMWEIIRRDRNK